jgi:hypothetical protein
MFNYPTASTELQDKCFGEYTKKQNLEDEVFFEKNNQQHEKVADFLDSYTRSGTYQDRILDASANSNLNLLDTNINIRRANHDKRIAMINNLKTGLLDYGLITANSLAAGATSAVTVATAISAGIYVAAPAAFTQVATAIGLAATSAGSSGAIVAVGTALATGSAVAFGALAVATSPLFATAAAVAIVGAGLYGIFKGFTNSLEDHNIRRLSRIQNYVASDEYSQAQTDAGLSVSEALLQRQKVMSQSSDLMTSLDDGHSKDEKRLLKDLELLIPTDFKESQDKSPSLAETYEATRDEQTPQQGLKLAY